MGIGNRLHTCSREHLNQPQRQTIRRDLTLSHAKPNRLAQPVQRLLRKGSFELTCHRANVFALHPKPPDRLVVLLIKRSDRVEHFKFPLFFNKFKDPTYDGVLTSFGVRQFCSRASGSWLYSMSLPDG